MAVQNIENLPFPRKYRPTTLKGYIGNEKLKETVMRSLSSGKRPQVILMTGSSGCGKAQPLDSHVLTTSGFKRMGDIKVGDEVFTHNGNKAKVSGVFPQGVRPIYRITLSDRTYIDVSDEHLNCVYRYNATKKVREDYVLTTMNLIKMHSSSRFKLRIDVPSVDFCSEATVPIDAYLLGALIGDGNLCGDGLIFSNSEEDVLSNVSSILYRDYRMTLKYKGHNSYDYSIRSIFDTRYTFAYKGEVLNGFEKLQKRLEEEGYPSFDEVTLVRIGMEDAPLIFSRYPELKGAVDIQINDEYRTTVLRDTIRGLELNKVSSCKFIPKQYLFSDRETKLRLLQGLFDTDGTISKNGGATFSTSSRQLSEDFAFLVRSLGIRDTISEKQSSYSDSDNNVIQCGISYRHYLKVPNSLKFFTSKKHSLAYNVKQTEPIRNIVSIERIKDQECQCIMVDHPDHTYISDFFIPTHNTTMARLLAKEYSCYDRDEEMGACGVCSSCTAIDEYITTGATDMLMNIKEVNVSDQSGKNDLNDILEDMQIPSFGDEWKVYIFDECHKASEGLQNLLLKPIEEPPEHVLMIFCTTNPEKLIPTFLNRCQLTLEVTKPSIKELAGLLKYVCTNEGVEYDKDGLEFIAKRSEFTIRTALQNLQQVVNEQNSAKFDNVTQVFEQVSNTLIIDFFKALKNRDTLRYVTLLTQVKSKMDLSVFLSELKGFIKRGIYVINGIDQDDITDLEIPIYRQLFSDLGLSEIATLLNKILTFHSNNLELELLMWGYTGLVSETGTSDKQQIIKPKDEEITQEVAEALKNVKEKEEVTYEEGVANAERLNTAVTIEDILSMGGSLVE